MAVDRLQKILAHAGVASRRAAETYIREGRVRVNGRVVTELGTRADAHRDKIEVDGRRIVQEKPAYYLVHKPREVVTTLSDPEGRQTLGELLDRVPERVYPVGRLDYHTSGILLVTNDGDMTDALLHPKRKVPKVYVAKLKGHIGVPELDRLRNGVELDDGYTTKPAEVFVIREEPKNTWVQITLTEGKNRQIHRMAEAIGHPVQRLTRQSFAGLTLEGLRPGQWRPLQTKELAKLKKQYLNPARKERLEADLEEAEQAAAPVRSPGMRPTPKRKTPARRGPKPAAASGGRSSGGRSSGRPDSKPSSKPSGGRSSDAKPTSGRPSSGRPGSGKPGSGKSGSGKPNSGKPNSGKPGSRSSGKPGGASSTRGKPAGRSSGAPAGAKPGGRPGAKPKPAGASPARSKPQSGGASNTRKPRGGASGGPRGPKKTTRRGGTR